MRKVKQKNVDKKVRNNSSGKADSRAPQKLESIDDDDLGFGGWLRSPQGLENMKLFVIANSIILLTTLGLPHVQSVIEIIVQNSWSKMLGVIFRLFFVVGILFWYTINFWKMISNYFNEEFKKTVLTKVEEEVIEEFDEL